MDYGIVVVLVLMLAAAVFLVYAERNSRRNEAKLKAESAARDCAVTRPVRPPTCKRRSQVKGILLSFRD
jgi:hypothetical protein